MGGIALFPSNNSSEGWYFMSLITGYKVHKYTWTIRPANDLVSLKVKETALSQNENIIGKNFKYFYKYLFRRMLDNINNNELDLNSETEIPTMKKKMMNQMMTYRLKERDSLKFQTSLKILKQQLTNKIIHQLTLHMQQIMMKNRHQTYHL